LADVGREARLEAASVLGEILLRHLPEGVARRPGSSLERGRCRAMSIPGVMTVVPANREKSEAPGWWLSVWRPDELTFLDEHHWRGFHGWQEGLEA